MAELHWSVTVEVEGKEVVTIAHNCLSGDPSPNIEAIRTAAHHLLSFIGDPQPSLREFDPGMNPVDDAEFGMKP